MTMTREEAEAALSVFGANGDEGFPLLEAAIVSAEHDYSYRSTGRVRLLGFSVVTPEDHRAWLDVAAGREAQCALAGAPDALARARDLDGPATARAEETRRRVMLRLN